MKIAKIYGVNPEYPHVHEYVWRCHLTFVEDEIDCLREGGMGQDRVYPDYSIEIEEI